MFYVAIAPNDAVSTSTPRVHGCEKLILDWNNRFCCTPRCLGQDLTLNCFSMSVSKVFLRVVVLFCLQNIKIGFGTIQTILNIPIIPNRIKLWNKRMYYDFNSATTTQSCVTSYIILCTRSNSPSNDASSSRARGLNLTLRPWPVRSDDGFFRLVRFTCSTKEEKCWYCRNGIAK